MDVSNLPTFFNAEILADFWGYTKWLLIVGSPLLMIYTALQIADLLAHGILDIFFKKKKKDDDDGYDTYYY